MFKARPIVAGGVLGLSTILAMSSWPLAFVFVGLDMLMLSLWFSVFEGAAVLVAVSIGVIVAAVLRGDRARGSQENKP
jgi:hypothetical protein